MAAAKKVRRVPKIVASVSAYLDPLGCDSTVSYKVINSGRRVWGSILLSDCGRKIEWYFGIERPLHKIDKAIAMLQEFRAAFVGAQKSRVVRIRRARVK